MQTRVFAPPKDIHSQHPPPTRAHLSPLRSLHPPSQTRAPVLKRPFMTAAASSGHETAARASNSLIRPRCWRGRVQADVMLLGRSARSSPKA